MVHVKLEFVRLVKDMSNVDLELIIAFQTTIIPSVLESDLPWTKVCTDQNAADFLIVPLDGAGNYDRDCLRKVLAPPVEHKSGQFLFDVSFSILL